jgi:hypothetical protein
MENPSASLMTSSTMVCLRVSMTFPLLPTCSCCFRPWSLMLLLNFGCVHHLFSNIHPLWAPRTTLSSNFSRLASKPVVSTSKSVFRLPLVPSQSLYWPLSFLDMLSQWHLACPTFLRWHVTDYRQGLDW